MADIFITGDKHGPTGNLRKDFLPENFPEGEGLTRDDCVVILGDFGALWSNPPSQDELTGIHRLSAVKPWTTLVVDGNHENFDLLDALPSKNLFGAPVGVIAQNVYHLRRGYVYMINGRSCFVFGGAYSPDKEIRTPGKSWWYREGPSREETERGFAELERVNWKVDYVFTHAAPTRVRDHVLEFFVPPEDRFPVTFRDATGEYLDIIAERLEFRIWAFGHYHVETPMFRMEGVGAGGCGYFKGLYGSVKQIFDLRECRPEPPQR